jgi:hypothetical protein
MRSARVKELRRAFKRKFRRPPELITPGVKHGLYFERYGGTVNEFRRFKRLSRRAA